MPNQFTPPPVIVPVAGTPQAVFDPWLEANSGILTPYYGDPTINPTTYGTLPAISNSLQDPTPITPQIDTIIDLLYYDTLLVLVDVALGSATDIRVQAFFDPKAAFPQGTQEARVDDGTANQRKWQSIVHVFAASQRYYIQITRQARYCKLQFLATGTLTNAKLALAVNGQRRIHS